MLHHYMLCAGVAAVWEMSGKSLCGIWSSGCHWISIDYDHTTTAAAKDTGPQEIEAIVFFFFEKLATKPSIHLNRMLSLLYDKNSTTIDYIWTKQPNPAINVCSARQQQQKKTPNQLSHTQISEIMSLNQHHCLDIFVTGRIEHIKNKPNTVPKSSQFICQ